MKVTETDCKLFFLKKVAELDRFTRHFVKMEHFCGADCLVS